jgi:hypothetical protein
MQPQPVPNQLQPTIVNQQQQLVTQEQQQLQSGTTTSNFEMLFFQFSFLLSENRKNKLAYFAHKLPCAM